VIREIVQFAVGASNVVTSLVSTLSALLPFLALCGLGFQLWASSRPLEGQSP
jgi:hypothetical protein